MEGEQEGAGAVAEEVWKRAQARAERVGRAASRAAVEQGCEEKDLEVDGGLTDA